MLFFPNVHHPLSPNRVDVSFLGGSEKILSERRIVEISIPRESGNPVRPLRNSEGQGSGFPFSNEE